MGTGKTAVGTVLADRLGYLFLDTDMMIEKETGKRISEIFEKEGETAFRVYEKKMVKKALDKEKVVISMGGGAVIDSENLSLMKQKGFVIGLSASPEAIFQRISSSEDRPLLNSKDAMKKIKNLLSHRSAYYREADCIIDTTSQLIEQTVEKILKVLHENSSR